MSRLITDTDSALIAWEEHLRSTPSLPLTPPPEDTYLCEITPLYSGVSYTKALTPLYRGLDSRWTLSIATNRRTVSDRFAHRFKEWQRTANAPTVLEPEWRHIEERARATYDRLSLAEWMAVSAPAHLQSLSDECWESGRVHTARLLGNLMESLGSPPHQAGAVQPILAELHSTGDLPAVLNNSSAPPGDCASLVARLVLVTVPVVSTCESPFTDIPGDVRTNQICPACSGGGGAHFKDAVSPLKESYRERRQKKNTTTFGLSDIDLPSGLLLRLGVDPAGKERAVAQIQEEYATRVVHIWDRLQGGSQADGLPPLDQLTCMSGPSDFGSFLLSALTRRAARSLLRPVLYRPAVSPHRSQTCGSESIDA